jgi:MFS family permease
MLMIACGLGLFLPTSSALIINMVDEEKKGWVLGVTQSISSLARIVGPGLAGLFFENIGRNSPYIIGGVFIIIVGIIFKKYIFSSKKLI